MIALSTPIVGNTHTHAAQTVSNPGKCKVIQQRRPALWATQTTGPAPKCAPGYVFEAADEVVMAKTPPARQNLPLDRQKHVAQRRVRRNTHRERSPEASSMHGRGPDRTHFCLSGYTQSRERRTSLIRATYFRDQSRVNHSDIMLNRRSASSRPGTAAEACGPSG